MTDEEIIKAYEAIKERENAKAGQTEHRRLVDKVRCLRGETVTVEGPVEEYNFDYLNYNNYVERFNDYLDDLPLGCIVRITVEVIGPTE
jgi:hypothetical protein